MSNIEHEDINAASIQQLNYDQALSAGDFGYDQDFTIPVKQVKIILV